MGDLCPVTFRNNAKFSMIRLAKAVTTFSRDAITLDHPLPTIFGDSRKYLCESNGPTTGRRDRHPWDQVHKFLVSPLFLYIQRPT